MARFRSLRPAQKVLAGQRPVDVLGGLVRGGHQGHIPPHDVGDRPHQQRVVGAAEDEGVHAGGLDGGQVLLGDVEHLGAGGHPPLGQLDEARARLRDELDAGNGLEGVVVGTRVDRPTGGDQPHLAVAGHSGRGTCRRVDDLDDRNSPSQGVALPRIVQDGRRGGVAGDDEQLDPSVHELVHDAQSQRPDLGDVPGTIGTVGGVPDVEHLLMGQLVEDRTGDGEATDPRVEHPDRSIIHTARLCGPCAPEQRGYQ